VANRLSDEQRASDSALEQAGFELPVPPRLPCRVRRRKVPGSDSASVRAVTWANTKAAAVPYSRTIPIQNMVLSPTSTSYLRTKVSLPSSPMRNTERPAGIVFTVSPSFTLHGQRTRIGCWYQVLPRWVGAMTTFPGWNNL